MVLGSAWVEPRSVDCALHCLLFVHNQAISHAEEEQMPSSALGPMVTFSPAPRVARVAT
jgi:hypothetical protein